MGSSRRFDSESRAAHYLALLQLPGVGLVTLRRLTSRAGTLEELVGRPWTSEDLATGNLAGSRLSSAARTTLAALPARVSAALPQALRTVREARAAGLGVFTVDDPEYPPALREGLALPPPLLFVEGTLPRALASDLAALPAAAIVGTRRASANSLSFTRDLAAGLARLGAIVVSGLALGVDAAAHAGALAGASEAAARGGATVAVLGGGHRHFHPPANRALGAAIAAAGGAVISEWPPEVTPAPHQFLQRNRLISGLARAVVVVEASQRSGALSTAAHALEQGRDVFVVPGWPGPAMAGSLALLRDGAGLLEGIADLDKTYAGVPGLGPAISSLVLRPREGAGPDHNGAATRSPLAQRVWQVLTEASVVTIDDLLAALTVAGRTTGRDSTGPSTATVTAALLELEVAGLVVRSANGRYSARPSVTRKLPAPGLR